MAYDVSVIIPAYRAEAFICDAVASVRRQKGLAVEIVIAADDETDYAGVLAEKGIDIRDIEFGRTAHPQGGPALARNLAASMARSDILACLDADDAFGDDRLRPLVGLAGRHGVATGPTVEITEDGMVARIARPESRDAGLLARDIATVRMPYFPVFQRQYLGTGWPDLPFAEDMIFNLELRHAAGDYAFAEDATYTYCRRPGSLTEAPDTLQRARRAYLRILDLIETRPWPGPVRAMVRDVIAEDLANVEKVTSADAVGSRASWREALAGDKSD